MTAHFLAGGAGPPLVSRDRDPRSSRGVAAFIEGLHRCGALPCAIDRHVVYTIEPVEGRFAGEPFETAVEMTELARWPLVPPHWIHLPADVKLHGTNSRSSSIGGWHRHSRHIAGWGRDADPASGWLAHVRSVVGQAR
jgi:hypothetical protein